MPTRIPERREAVADRPARHMIISSRLRRRFGLGPRSPALLGLLTGLGLGLSLAACSEVAEIRSSGGLSPQRATVWRWFDDEPADRFSSQLLERTELVHEWRFDSVVERGRWRAVGGPGRLIASDHGAVLSSPNGQVVLSNRSAGDDIRSRPSPRVDRIEVLVERRDDSREGAGSAILHWRSSGEEFSSSRESFDHGGTQRVEVGDNGSLVSRRVFRLDLAEPVGESDGQPRDLDELRATALDELRLSFRLPESATLVLHSVRALRVEPSDGALESMARDGIWVDLEGSMRPALPAWPRASEWDRFFTRTLEVPARARLRLAHSVPTAFDTTTDPTSDITSGKASDGAPEPDARFRVSVVDQVGASVEVYDSDESRDLAGPAGESQDRWREVAIDLDRWAGKTVDLQLAFDGPSEFRGLAWWAEPVLDAPVTVDPAEAADPSGGARASRRPNVILVSIDTLRADRLSVYGHERATTPNLARWGRERAVVFEQTVASAPWTLPSHASMLTGIDALRHGTNYLWTRLAPEATTLAEILRDEGYATAAVTGGGVLDPDNGFYQGFDRYDYADEAFGTADELRLGLDRALEFVDRFRRPFAPNRSEALSDRDERPFFLFFHTYEVHAPYRARQPWFSRFTDLPDHFRVANFDQPPPPDRPMLVRKELRLVEEATTAQWAGSAADRAGGRPISRPLPPDLADLPGLLYDAGIAYTDAQLGRLFTALSLTGVDDDTVVIITSDHGEMLGEHGLAGHTSLFDENLLIPLLIASPDHAGSNRRVSQQVRSVDILPTVLDLVGIEHDEVLDGRSMLNLIQAVSDGSSSAGARRLAESEPRDALSYAGRYGAGLSLRIGGSGREGQGDRAQTVPRGPLKYVLNTSPFGGRDRLYRLWRDPGEVFDVASTAPEMEDLSRRLSRRLMRDLPGLRIRFENPGKFDLSGTLAGTAIDPSRLVATRTCRCLQVSALGEVSFHLAAGEAFDLVAEEPGGGELIIQAQGQSGSGGVMSTTERFTLLPNDPVSGSPGDEAGWQVDRVGSGLGLTAAGWRRVRGRPRSTGGSIWVRWHGPRTLRHSDRSQSSADIDRKLEQRLRALGYL